MAEVKANAKRERKAKKRLQDSETYTPSIPTGTDKARMFFRVSKGRKKLWSRQYMQHRKTGTIVKVEVKENQE